MDLRGVASQGTVDMGSAMYIRELHVKNLKLMRDFRLSFCDSVTGEPRKWTVLVGRNARGKTRSQALANSFASFRPAEPALVDVDPMRVRLFALPEATTLAALQETRPSAITLPRLALLNGIEDPEALLPAGMVIERVEGFDPTAVAADAGPSKPPEHHTPG